MAYENGIFLLKLCSVLDTGVLKEVFCYAKESVKRRLYVSVYGLTGRSHVEEQPSVVQLNEGVTKTYYVSSCIAPSLDVRVPLMNMRRLVTSQQASQFAIPQLTEKTLVAADADDEEVKSLFSETQPAVLPIATSNKNDSVTKVQLNETSKILEKVANVENLSPPSAVYKNVVLGGTFDRLHAGHKILLSAAILRCASSLTIGVTDGPMVKSKKLWELIEPCEVRINKLREFLMDVEPSLEYRIVPITDPYGPTAYDPDLQLLVVSEETLPGATKVNNLRKEKGLPILDVHPIELVGDEFACDDEEAKISSSSLRKRLLGTHLKPPKSKPHSPYVIGLTGGIASGKTSISKRLQDLGAHVISCDQLGHRAYKKGTNCYQGIVSHFGSQVLDSQGEIDRKKLGPIVFQNKNQLEKLNDLVWPEIRRLYLEEISGPRNHSVIVLDAAILLEAGWDQDCDEVWVSFVPKEEAVKRIMNRDSLTEISAVARIESQLSNVDRLAKADVALCSLWDYDVTAAQVKRAWDELQDFLSRKYSN